MTEPAPDDVTATETDELVEPTGNGLQPDDPDDQPSQEPGDLPDGTQTAGT
jgi:hypothetical protein